MNLQVIGKRGLLDLEVRLGYLMNNILV